MMTKDHVACNNCMIIHHIQVGGNSCSHCHTEGTLSWADEVDVTKYVSIENNNFEKLW